MTDPAVQYPATLAIDYPDRKLKRASSIFRCILIIPIAIVLAFVVRPVFSDSDNTWGTVFAWGAILFIPTLLMILFRRKYPRWWFDWNLGVTRFCTRVGAYAMLMTDVYPSTDEEQIVHLEIVYPDAKKDLLPGLPLVKWFLAIPHYICLFGLAIAAFVCLIIVWFAILFTARYPRGLFDFIVGVMRWGLRVSAYAFMLVTDVYPPFSLD